MVEKEPKETKDQRNARLFQQDIARLLEDKTQSMSGDLFRIYTSTWSIKNDSVAIKKLNEIGWTLTNSGYGSRLEPLPKEQSISPESNPVTVVHVDKVPHVQRPGPAPDSDGTPYRHDEDA